MVGTLGSIRLTPGGVGLTAKSIPSAHSETTPARIIGPGWLRLIGSLGSAPANCCRGVVLDGQVRLWTGARLSRHHRDGEAVTLGASPPPLGSHHIMRPEPASVYRRDVSPMPQPGDRHPGFIVEPMKC
jgi:hypothetical protein